MSDRLALTNAFEDAGMERGKAQRVATVIFDAIHENVATKSDVEAVRADLHLVEHRLMTRLGGLAVVLSGLIIAVLHFWAPHG